MKGNLTIARATLEPLFRRVEDLLTGHYTQPLPSALEIRPYVYMACAQFVYYVHAYKLTSDINAYLVDEFLFGSYLSPQLRGEITHEIGVCFLQASQLLSGLVQRIIFDLSWNGETLHDIAIVPSPVNNLLILSVETQMDELDQVSAF